VGIVDLDEGSVYRVDLGVLFGVVFIILQCCHLSLSLFQIPLCRIRALK
jgi:hypothetical protein